VNKTVIDLLRHGEVQGGACFRGSQDDTLTKTGWRQMQQQTQPYHWHGIISSPLKRCRLFAEHLSQQQHIPLTLEKGLQEIYFGHWEGKTAEQISQTSANQLQQFYQDPIHNPPPSGESFNSFQQRVTQSWHRLLKKHQGQHILIITHAGVIRLLFSQIFKLPYTQCFQFDIAPANLTRFSLFHHDHDDFIQLTFHQPAEKPDTPNKTCLSERQKA
jgi:alpha-ribazole phosphatase/probable phosphoglycerate mutase